MKILAISQYFTPDITAAAFRIHDMVSWLSCNGHDITLLTSHPHKAQTEDRNELAIENLELRRTRLLKIGSGGLARYLAHYFSFVVGSILHGIRIWLRRRRFDVVWISSPPLFAGISGLYLSFLFRCPLVLEIRDIWPDTAVAAGQISRDGPGYRLGRKLELMLYRRSEHIICVSQPMRDYIVSLTDVPVTVIYNGVSAGTKPILRPVDDEGLSEKRSRTLIYAGNLGLLQELDYLIRAFHELRHEDHLEQWRIRLIGSGPEREKLELLSKELHLSDVVSIESPMSRGKIAKEMEKAAFLFVSLRHHPVLARTIPSKVFDCLLVGKPILACLSGEGTEILDRTGANIWCEPGNLRALKKMLLEADTQYDVLSRNASKNQDLVLERYTRELGTQKLLDVFNTFIIGAPS